MSNLIDRMSKRRFLGLAALTMAGSALAACSQAAPASPSAAATTAPAAAPAATASKPAAAATTTGAAASQPTTAPTAASQSTTVPAAAPPATAATTAGSPVKGGTLNYAEAGDFNDFNPWGFGAVNFEMYDQVFSRLLWKDGAGKANPDLGESWETASDNHSFTVKLRQGATWHDGKPVTAADFVTMYGYLKDPVIQKYTGAQKIAGLFAPITGVTAVDDQTVQFSFDNPLPYITDVLDYFFLIRIDDKNDPKFLKTLPIGTGPFKMTQWVPSQYAKFDRFAGYFQTGQPYLDEFMFKRLSQAETLVPNLRSGAEQDILVTSLSDVGPLQSDPTYQVAANENSGSIFNLLVNSHKAPFDKKEVRQAFSYSLDREGMVKSAFFGVSKPITSPFYSPSSLAYKQELVMAHPFDLGKAKSLLTQAGVSNLEIEIHPTPAWPQMKLFCLIWQQDLAKIGVKMTVQEVESAKFYDIGGDGNLRGFYLHPWLTGRTTRDPAIFFATQTNYRGDAKNIYGYQSAQLNQLVGHGAVETDENKRRQIYQQTNQILVDDTPMIQVATNPRIWAYTTKLHDVDIDLNGNLFLERAWLAK
ncbi:MAG TPA: ABC transporter substrate-binding protein [Chloroflexota bacterium]|nr:ABC transporter substrate-binding protein [Chloroflexota bacterium]